MLKTRKKLYKAEDLYKLDGLYEIERGVLLPEKGTNMRHGRTTVLTSRILLNYVEEHDLGEVVAEDVCILARDPDTARRPDVFFVSNQRLVGHDIAKFYPAGPDLAVEIVSPNNRIAELRRKMQQYFSVGTTVGWILDPMRDRAFVCRPGADEIILGIDDTIDAEPVLPGFRGVVRDLFERKKRSQA